ncbi:FUSC-like inner membrane yccS family protein, partial [Vibrio parahaemolyticus VP2007-007]
IHSHR